mmetsp:Transcript_22874/g.33418  ORF Transcript_22874/g.33418 Transcript_22874/m.33418 type:complete len:206 (+) Transcript_22874:107-724(+)
MVCCLICFSPEPVEGDERSFRPNSFQISLMDAVCKGQPCCCISCFCPCCAAFKARKDALDGDMSRYICCQGYIPGCLCCKAGSCGESSCPDCCLCLEAFLCVGPSMSSSRLYMMDKYQLANDPCDNRLIRLNNCLQILSCICDILAIFIQELRELATLLRCIADTFFYSLMGCMSAQINYEVEYRKSKQGGHTPTQAIPVEQAKH